MYTTRFVVWPMHIHMTDMQCTWLQKRKCVSPRLDHGVFPLITPTQVPQAEWIAIESFFLEPFRVKLFQKIQALGQYQVFSRTFYRPPHVVLPMPLSRHQNSISPVSLTGVGGRGPWWQPAYRWALCSSVSPSMLSSSSDGTVGRLLCIASPTICTKGSVTS